MENIYAFFMSIVVPIFANSQAKSHKKCLQEWALL